METRILNPETKIRKMGTFPPPLRNSPNSRNSLHSPARKVSPRFRQAKFRPRRRQAKKSRHSRNSISAAENLRPKAVKAVKAVKPPPEAARVAAKVVAAAKALPLPLEAKVVVKVVAVRRPRPRRKSRQQRMIPQAVWPEAPKAMRRATSNSRASVRSGRSVVAADRKHKPKKLLKTKP